MVSAWRAAWGVQRTNQTATEPGSEKAAELGLETGEARQPGEGGEGRAVHPEELAVLWRGVNS